MCIGRDNGGTREELQPDRGWHECDRPELRMLLKINISGRIGSRNMAQRAWHVRVAEGDLPDAEKQLRDRPFSEGRPTSADWKPALPGQKIPQKEGLPSRGRASRLWPLFGETL